MPQVTGRTTFSARLLNRPAASRFSCLNFLVHAVGNFAALPDALSIRKNFFVTGDYVVGG